MFVFVRESKHMGKQLTQDIILVLVVVAGIVSFFYNPIGGEAIKYLQTLAGGIVGYYLGLQDYPIARAIRGRK